MEKVYFIRRKGNKKIIISDINYKLILDINNKIIYIVGLIHDLEYYSLKIFQ